MTGTEIGLLALDLARATGAFDAYLLLYEIHALAGARVFTGAEVCAHAERPENARLRAALEAACNVSNPDQYMRALGNFLRCWEARDVVSLRVDRVKRESLGWTWCIARPSIHARARGGLEIVDDAAVAT